MKTLNLNVTMQGVKGNKIHSQEEGFAMLTIRKNGERLGTMSIDTYSGQGLKYEERKEPLIEISFATTSGLDTSYIGTMKELKEKLFGKI